MIEILFSVYLSHNMQKTHSSLEIDVDILGLSEK